MPSLNGKFQWQFGNNKFFMASPNVMLDFSTSKFRWKSHMASLNDTASMQWHLKTAHWNGRAASKATLNGKLEWASLYSSLHISDSPDSSSTWLVPPTRDSHIETESNTAAEQQQKYHFSVLSKTAPETRSSKFTSGTHWFFFEKLHRTRRGAWYIMPISELFHAKRWQ